MWSNAVEVFSIGKKSLHLIQISAIFKMFGFVFLSSETQLSVSAMESPLLGGLVFKLKKLSVMYHECKSKGYKMIYFLFWYSFFCLMAAIQRGVSGGV